MPSAMARWWQRACGSHTALIAHICFLYKSFTSTAIGFAVEEGRLIADDLVCDFFPEQVPEVISPNLAKMSIHHLLSMSNWP